MKRACDLEQFAHEPVGKYLIGSSWLYWCFTPTLYGFSLWGRLNAEGAESLVEAIRLELRPNVLPHRSLLDVGRVQSVDMQAFDTLQDYVRTNRDSLSRSVVLAAMVVPTGMVGALAAGFYRVLDAPHPVSLFKDRRKALAALRGCEDNEFAVELDQLYSEAAGTTPVVSALRAQLTEHLLKPNISQISRALGLSKRTLQRRLRAAGTTFQSEVVCARITAAKNWLRDGDASLIRVALGVGFSSAQTFSEAFRRATGTAPGAWRTQQRLGTSISTEP